MIISLVAAMDSNRLIGVSNQLPWRLPADMRRFRAVTMGKTIVMGRKTHESIGKPLPGRTNIVLTRSATYRAEGCCVVGSISDAFDACSGIEELVVIGGANVYEQTLAQVTHLYLTTIHHAFEGDEYFPAFAAQAWQETNRENFDADDKNAYAYTFVDLVRKPLNPS